MPLYGEYTGPFNPMGRKPVDAFDAASRRHDIGYGKLGKKAYYKWNKYDQSYLDKIRKVKAKSYRGEFVRRGLAIPYFTSKKFLLSNKPLKSNRVGSMPKRVSAYNPRGRFGYSGKKYKGPRKTYQSVGVADEYRVNTRDRRRRRRKQFRRKSLRVQLYQIKKSMKKLKESPPQVHTSIASGQITCNDNQVTYLSLACTANSVLDGQMVLAMKDPSAGTMHDVDMSGVNGALMKWKESQNVTLRNNHKKTVKVWIYNCFAKVRTSSTAQSLVTTGLDDFAHANNAGETDPTLWPSDSKDLKSTWKVRFAKYCVLTPGQEVTFTYSSSYHIYDPDIFDTHSFAYSPGMHQFLVRMQGTICNDGTTNVALSDGQLDRVTKCRFTSFLVYKNAARKLQASDATGLDAIAAASQIQSQAQQTEELTGLS